MKIALVFAGGTSASAALAPYRSQGFIGALQGEGLEPIIVDIESAARPGLEPVCYDGAPRAFRNPAERLPAILRQEGPQLVQTFGWASELGRVWTTAAPPLVHFVSAGGPVEGEGDLHLAWRRIRPSLRSLAGWSARFASRRVRALIGSNRADMGEHLSLGFFPRATFSVVAPPPVAPPSSAAGAARARADVPTFGVYDPGATAASLQFLLRAIALTGHLDFFRVVFASAGPIPPLPGNVAVVAAASAQDFVRAIDVLVVPYGEDRMTASVVAALAARKTVIVPDGGVAAELIEYGRHGVLYQAGSAYHLAMAINVVTQAWRNRPFDFAGVDEGIARTAPRAVARAFAAAYRRAA